MVHFENFNKKSPKRANIHLQDRVHEARGAHVEQATQTQQMRRHLVAGSVLRQRCSVVHRRRPGVVARSLRVGVLDGEAIKHG